jgi:16S rRNA processing protein RimM
MQVMVGRIGRAHGLRGEVLIGVRTDEPEARFAPGSVLHTDQGPLTVEASRWHSGQLLVRFAGCADRSAAEELRGRWLSIDSETLPPPDDPDEFRDHDLVGLAVETTGGVPVGVVTDVLHFGQDLLEIRRTGGGQLLVPFVKAIVPDVDLGAGRIRIDPPHGLLDSDSGITGGSLSHARRHHHDFSGLLRATARGRPGCCRGDRAARGFPHRQGRGSR